MKADITNATEALDYLHAGYKLTRSPRRGWVIPMPEHGDNLTVSDACARKVQTSRGVCKTGEWYAPEFVVE